MSLALTTHDHELLLTVGEHRVLTSTQAAILRGRNGPATRRRLGALNELGLVAARHSGLGHGSGRPEKLFSLSAEGVAFGTGANSCSFERLRPPRLCHKVTRGVTYQADFGTRKTAITALPAPGTNA